MSFEENRRHVAQLLKNEAYLMTHDLETQFHQIAQQMNLVAQDTEGTKQTMATYQEDQARLEADIQAQSDAVTKVQATLSDNQAQIKTLQAALDAQKAQGVDTTAEEAALAKLESNTLLLASLPAAPASVTPGTPTAPETPTLPGTPTTAQATETTGAVQATL